MQFGEVALQATADVLAHVEHALVRDLVQHRVSTALPAHQARSVEQSQVLRDVLLRGEIPESIETSIQYLDTIEREVRRRIERGIPKRNLRRLSIERCHKSRIPLNGLAEELHQANLSYLYDLLLKEA